MSDRNITEAINNLKKPRQMSVKYAATSDQKSLMCFENGNPSSETFLDYPKINQNVSLQACSRVQLTFALQSHCGETSFEEERNLLLESLLINSSHALLRDWVVHGARVL